LGKVKGKLEAYNYCKCKLRNREEGRLSAIMGGPENLFALMTVILNTSPQENNDHDQVTS
jgi:hypothetical protein